MATNGNAQSLQILRGAITYDPSSSEEVLLDGQPFYSKKTKKFYIGDGVTKLKSLCPVNDFIEDLSIRYDTLLVFDGGDSDVTIAILDDTILG